MKMGICSVLGLIFVALKLTGVIAWSWLWVLLPLWGPVALGLSCCYWQALSPPSAKPCICT